MPILPVHCVPSITGTVHPQYGYTIRDILNRIASDEAEVERQVVLEYFRGHVEQIALEDAVEEWREDLLAYGVERLSEERSDPND